MKFAVLKTLPMLFVGSFLARIFIFGRFIWLLKLIDLCHSNAIGDTHICVVVLCLVCLLVVDV